jgi:heptosyltransferase-2
MQTSDPQKILVLRLSSIGDVVLTTPVLRALRLRFPLARIDFLVKSKYACLLEGNPHLDRVLTLPDASGTSALLHTLADLRRQRYDLLIDLHKNWRTTLLRLGVRAPDSRVYRKHVFRRALYVWLKKDSLALPSTVQRYFHAVLPLGVVDDGRGPELHLSVSARRRTKVWLRELGWNGEPAIGLVPGAGYLTKCWPSERYAELGRRLAKPGRQVFIFGSKEDQEAASLICHRVGPRAVNLAGRLSLSESVAAIGFCELVIANDTGLMHVANALGKKLVAIFGSTTGGLGFLPHGRDVRVIEADVGCRPCSHLGRSRCPRGHFRCMNDITVERVQQAAEHLWSVTESVTV